MQKPHIPVVIPAFNEEKCIGDCLASLAAQRTHHRFEVIVVDNESTDDTMAIVRQFQDILDIHTVNVRVRRRGNARFMGCKEARGNVLFCTDADVVLPPDWLERGMRYLQRQHVVAVSGTCRIDDCAPHINIFYNIWSCIWAYLCRVMMGTYLFRGANIAMKREAYVAAGQFDPNADAHEDADLATRVADWGTILFRPTWLVSTSGRRFQNGLLRGGMHYVQTFIRKFLFRERYIRFSNVR